MQALSHVQIFATPWTAAHHSFHGIFQAGILEWVAFPSPGDLPNSGIEPTPTSPALAVRFFRIEPPGKPPAGYVVLGKLLTISVLLLLVF